MSSHRDKLEKKMLYLTLSSAVKSLEGLYTTVDLRNESCVTGKISNVDGFMNVEMDDVIFYDPRGEQHVFETFFVPKRMIRYVHIPKEVDIQDSTQMLFENMCRPMPDYKRSGRTFKQKRAQLYQQEILKEAYTHTSK